MWQRLADTFSVVVVVYIFCTLASPMASAQTSPATHKPTAQATGGDEPPAQPTRDPPEKQFDTQQVIAEIRQLGGQVNASEAVEGKAAEYSVTFPSAAAVDEVLKRLRVIPALRLVNLTQTQLSDEGLAHLASITDLRTLYLSETRITSIGLKNLARLENLETLYLRGTAIDDAGLAHLNRLKRLKMLNLERTKIGDGALAHLQHLDGLEDLDLTGTLVTPTGMERLAECRALKVLDLSFTQVDDNGHALLVQLPELRVIRLAGTKVTDTFTNRLAELQHLQEINLIATAVSPSQLANLRKSLPTTRVYPDEVGQGPVTSRTEVTRLFGLAERLEEAFLHLGNSGRTHEAISYCEQTVAVYRRFYPKANSRLVRVLTSLGTLRGNTKDFQGGRKAFEEALAVAQQLYPQDRFPNGRLEIVRLLKELASVSEVMGEAGAVRRYQDDQLAMLRKLFPQGHPDIAELVFSIGWRTTENDQMLSRFEQAAEEWRKIYPPDRPLPDDARVARCFAHLGLQLAMRPGEKERAIAFGEQAFSIAERIYSAERYPHGHTGLAFHNFYFGNTYQSAGELTRARPYLERAVELLGQWFPEGIAVVAQPMRDLAAIHQANHEYDRAREIHARAISMLERLFPRDKYPMGHNSLAGSLLAQSAFLTSRGEFEAGYQSQLRALRDLQDQLDAASMAVSEVEALRLASTVSVQLKRCISLWWQTQQSPEALYECVWRQRGIVFYVVSRRQRALLASLAPEVRTLYEQYLETRKQLSSLALSNPAGDTAAMAGMPHASHGGELSSFGAAHESQQPNRPAATVAQLHAARSARLEELFHRKEQLERDLSDQIPTELRPQTLQRRRHQDLRAALPSGAVFVDFLRLSRESWAPDETLPGQFVSRTSDILAAFIVSRDGKVQIVDLGPAKPIEDAVRRWREDIAADRMSHDNQMLRRLVWEPIESRFGDDIHTVFLAPDGSLTAMPWSALPGRTARSVLLEEYTLVAVPNGEFLLDRLTASVAPPSQAESILAVGDVHYDKESNGRSDIPLLATLRGNVEVDRRPNRWPALPGTREEIAHVEAHAGGRTVTTLVGAEASAANVVRHLPEARWTILSTHGFFADAGFRSLLDGGSAAGTTGGTSTALKRHPLVLSGVVLSGANVPDTVRSGGGILTAEAIAALPLGKLELAVLSACETGLGDLAAGEGVFGLQRAFHQAGTHQVVASLWKVDDLATATMMQILYQKLWQEKKPPAQALREAQLAMYYRYEPSTGHLSRGQGEQVEFDPARARPAELSGPRRASPRLWAAFALSGAGPAANYSLQLAPGLGRLAVLNRGPQQVQMRLRMEGGNSQLFTLDSSKTFDLPTGRYALELVNDTADYRVEPAMTSIDAGAARTTTVKWLWTSTDPELALPGLVHAPAALPGFGRWQIETRRSNQTIRDVAYDPQGRRLAAGRGLGHVVIYDVESREIQSWICAHRRSINAVCWSNDGAFLATAGGDAAVRLWDLNGNLLKSFKTAAGSANCLAFGADNRSLLAADSGGNIYVWSLDGKQLAAWKSEGFPIEALTVSPDGKRVVTAGKDKVIRWWQLDGKLLAAFEGHPGEVTSLAFATEGRLISADRHGSIRVWASDGAAVVVPNASTEAINDLAVSPDGFRFASVGVDRAVRVWKLDGTQAASFRGHIGNIKCVSWSPGGEQLVSAGYDKSIRFWAADGKPLAVIEGFQTDIHCISAAPDGSAWFTGGLDGSIRRWTATGSCELLGKHQGNSRTLSLALRPDGKQIASVGDDRLVRRWDIDGGSVREAEPLKGHTSLLRAVAYSADGKQLSSAGDDRTIRVWDATGSLIATLSGHTGPIHSIAWQPDGSSIASCSSDGSVRRWDIERQSSEVVGRHHPYAIALAWHPARRLLASGGQDQVVQLWNLNGGDSQALKFGAPVTSLAWNTDGSILSAASRYQRWVKSWTPEGVAASSFVIPGQDGFSAVRPLSKQRLLLADPGARLLYWDVDEAHPFWTALPLPQGGAVAFSAGGQLLNGDIALLDSEFVYLVEVEQGRIEILGPSEFHARLRAVVGGPVAR